MATLVLAIAAGAQTLNVQVGNVTYQFPATQTGDMTFTDGTQLTVMGRTFAIAEIDSITVDEARNPQHLCMSPLGVLRHRTCDAHSRDIFLVSALRAIGVPARIDEVTGKVEVGSPNLSEGGVKEEAKAGVRLFLTPDAGQKKSVSYYSHFALSRIEDGRPQLLEFPENATWENTFNEGVTVEPGQYMLLTGTRLANGGVMGHVEIGRTGAGGETRVPLRLRNDEDKLHVIGNFDCEQQFTNAKGLHKKILDTTGRGFYILALIRSGHEPSTHLLHDMEAVNIHISQWSQCYLMLFESQEDYDKFDKREFDDLPSNVLFGVADEQTAQAMHIEELSHGSQELPIVMLCDTFNRVYWYHQGYSIGLADRMMDVIRKVILME